MYYPYDESNDDDIKTTQDKLEFDYASCMDPLIFGDWPQAMKDLIPAERLANFTIDEQKTLTGTVDYLSLNYYASSFIKYIGIPG